MRIQTALTRMVGIEHPVVQTGMGWYRPPRTPAGWASWRQRL